MIFLPFPCLTNLQEIVIIFFFWENCSWSIISCFLYLAMLKKRMGISSVKWRQPFSPGWPLSGCSLLLWQLLLAEISFGSTLLAQKPIGGGIAPGYAFSSTSWEPTHALRTFRFSQDQLQLRWCRRSICPIFLGTTELQAYLPVSPWTLWP